MLHATEEFRSNKKTAEKRIFELVNSKIDDLVETAEYDWYLPPFPSNLSPSLTPCTGWHQPSKPSPAPTCPP